MPIERFHNGDLLTGANDGSDEANAWRSWPDIIFVAGERVNFKRMAARDDPGSNQTPGIPGDAFGKVWLRGYTNVIGDGGLYQFGRGLSIVGAGGINTKVEGFDIESANPFGAVLNMAANLGVAYRCKVKNTIATAGAAINITNSQAINCIAEVTDTAVQGGIVCNRGTVKGCRIIVPAGGIGIDARCGFRHNDILGNQIRLIGDKTGSVAIRVDRMDVGSMNIVGNSIYNFEIAVDFEEMEDGAGITAMLHANNIFWAVVTGFRNGQPSESTAIMEFAHNAIDGGATAYDGFNNADPTNPIVLTENPWTDVENDDWSLNDAAGGGALLKDAALPISFGLSVQDNFEDVGANQATPPPAAESSSSSSSSAGPSSSSSAQVETSESLSSSSSSLPTVTPIFPDGTIPENRLAVSSAVCSIGMRPLMITGILEHILLAHFADSQNLENPFLRKKFQNLRPATVEDLTGANPPGGILIAPASKWQPQTTEQRPAIIIRRNDWQWETRLIGNRIVGDGTPDQHERYTGWWRGSHTLFALARSGAEAEILGAEVIKLLTWYHSQIRDSFNLDRFVPVGAGALVEIEEAAEHYAVPVTVAYRGQENWAMFQNVPRLKTMRPEINPTTDPSP